MNRLRRGDTAALSRCLSLVEQGGAYGEAICRLCDPAIGHAAIVGFSGAPGAGKSTLIDARIAHVRAADRTVAVAAVDPSSPISGGSILGDRVRMQRHAEDQGVFIRSIASRGHLGGLTENIHRLVDLMDASGRDIIIIETVGVGQSEVEIVEVADVCVVVNAPNLGVVGPFENPLPTSAMTFKRLRRASSRSPTSSSSTRRTCHWRAEPLTICARCWRCARNSAMCR
jgi:LAO/AO transport system kinase